MRYFYLILLTIIISSCQSEDKSENDNSIVAPVSPEVLEYNQDSTELANCQNNMDSLLYANRVMEDGKLDEAERIFKSICSTYRPNPNMPCNAIVSSCYMSRNMILSQRDSTNRYEMWVMLDSAFQTCPEDGYIHMNFANYYRIYDPENDSLELHLNLCYEKFSDPNDRCSLQEWVSDYKTMVDIEKLNFDMNALTQECGYAMY